MVSISVIIPVYDVEPYVRRCLESVMAQSEVEARLECLVVDDCGHDGSMAIVRETLAGYHGPVAFRVLRHGQNRGLSAARNTGLDAATGDYVLFVDSDDYLLPGSVQCFLDGLAAYPRVDVLMANVEMKRNNSLLLGDLRSPVYLANAGAVYQRFLRHQLNAYAWAKLIRRDFLVANSIRFEEGLLYEDNLWAYRLFACLSSVVLLPGVVYSYEYNPGYIVGTTYLPGKADSVVRSYTITASKMLDTPPDGRKYQVNVAVDYLLFIQNILMAGTDVCMQCQVAALTARDFRAVRLRLLRRSLHYGRVVTSCFALLLFRPLNYLQRMKLVRHHYFKLEQLVGRVAHATDFLHRSTRM